MHKIYGLIMEKFTVLIPSSTAEMIHLLARDSGQNIGEILHEMALERYMRHALNSAEPQNEVDAAIAVQA
jgi:hypothetical protein